MPSATGAYTVTGFPRSDDRGRIEADRNRERKSRTTPFRDQMIAAALKLDVHPDGRVTEGAFRDQMIAAALKH